MPASAAEATRKSEVAELHSIIAYLETQLRAHSASAATLREQSQTHSAQLSAQRAELSDVRADRDRLRQHVVELQIRVQELADRLKQSEARSAFGLAPPPPPAKLAAVGAADVDPRWYDELARVENLLAAERRVNAELLRENANYRRLVLTRERELLNVTKASEIVAESESSQLVAAEQRLASAAARAAEFEEENRTLLAVQRAKTRTIEKLAEQLSEATERLSQQRANDVELASLRERHERTVAALGAARGDVERQHRQIEQLQARSTGVPFEQWMTERGLMRERIAALEARVVRAEASASSSATTARAWAARWRRLAAGVTAQAASLGALRTLVRKQREGTPAEEQEALVEEEALVEPFGSVALARQTMAAVLKKR